MMNSVRLFFSVKRVVLEYARITGPKPARACRDALGVSVQQSSDMNRLNKRENTRGRASSIGIAS
ncbi:hypothetical protein [Burkholderia sp. SCN-KJ]|uniref:hypothetical protein n=1 Tax=Burkholderia sp. SCN-KJ TaxID=2969248 RepID=UPI00214FCD38|nr:hypothetical protein [Burkholderia sp. SCN-KJ]MCR4465519.1 hypothetical protein [Burkholderia sp. SCN-KJ]